MSNFPVTPHINVQNEIGFGKTVLMPGDPLRAKFIAENFLENPVLVNNVRGVQGHTGYYKGVKVSVMASGMGMPAIGIYSHELFNFFGVENIIRVGSAGSIQDHINLYELVIAQGACTDSNFAHTFHLPGTFAPIASWELLSEAVKAAEANGATYHVGNVNSSDVFYGDHEGVPEGLDSVYIATDWSTHVKIAIEAMKKGIPAASEVGGAYTLEECWEVVDTYEETGVWVTVATVPCMIVSA